MSYKIFRNGEFISWAEQDSGKIGTITKLFGMNISEFFIEPDKMFVLIPASEPNDEFIYVLEGALIEDGQQFILNQGDSLLLSHIEKPIYCRANSKVKLLYISPDSVIQELTDSMERLHSMIIELDKKDQYTKKHSVRVIEWAPKVAKALALTSNQVKILTTAALFHDLGKLRIDDAILHKPGRLNDIEFSRIKEHPTIGRKIAEDHQLEEVGEVIEQHHERIDGSGYPNGLKGDDIRIEARIIAVIDSYDAMTSDRPYRSGMSRDEAVTELLKGKGTIYDAKVIDIFLRILNEQ